MYYSGFNKLFWGMLLLLIHVNIGSIPIFPSFIGYIFIYLGLYTLSKETTLFTTAKTIAIFSVIFSFSDILEVYISLKLNNYFDITALTLGIKVFTAFWDILLMYFILKAIYDLCLDLKEEKLKESTNNCLLSYILFSLIFSCAYIASINLPSGLKLALLVPASLKAIIVLRVAFLFKACKHISPK